MPKHTPDDRFIATALEPLTALELICDLASQEWQEADGSRKGAIDSLGERMWFISDSVMQDARAALARAKGTA